jgi:hypothetical protein
VLLNELLSKRLEFERLVQVARSDARVKKLRYLEQVDQLRVPLQREPIDLACVHGLLGRGAKVGARLLQLRQRGKERRDAGVDVADRRRHDAHAVGRVDERLVVFKRQLLHLTLNQRRLGVEARRLARQPRHVERCQLRQVRRRLCRTQRRLALALLARKQHLQQRIGRQISTHR